MCDGCVKEYEEETALIKAGELTLIADQVQAVTDPEGRRRPRTQHHGGYFFSIKNVIGSYGLMYPLPLDHGPIDEEFWLKQGYVRGPKTKSEADYRT